jgi:hypothetical protein
VKDYVHRTSVDVNATLLARIIEAICRCGGRYVDPSIGRTRIIDFM